MRLGLSGESNNQPGEDIMENFGGIRGVPAIDFLAPSDGKGSEWAHGLEGVLNRGKRYNEFLGKRADWFFPENTNDDASDDVMKRWNEFVGKRVPEMPFSKRYMEFLGKRQHISPRLLKRYVEFLG